MDETRTEPTFSIKQGRSRLSRTLIAAAGLAEELERQAQSLTYTKLLYAAMDELERCIEDLTFAERALRVQNDALEKALLARRLERRRYMDLFNSVPNALVVTDTSGLILAANPAASSLLRVGPRTLAGKLLIKFVDVMSRHAIHEALAIRDNETWEGILILQPYRARSFEANARVRQIPVLAGEATTLRWLLRFA